MLFQDGVEALQISQLTVVPDGWGQGVVDNLGELVATSSDLDDVAVGAGDVWAPWATIVNIGCDHGVVDAPAELTRCLGRVEDAGHTVAVKDLQQWIAE